MKYSLKKTSDFQTVYHFGKSKSNKYLVMYCYQNHLSENRLGISVSKKVGNSVVRHRITRLIREVYRKHIDQIETGYDIVVIARVNAKNRSYWDIEQSFMHLIQLHHIEKSGYEEKHEI